MQTDRYPKLSSTNRLFPRNQFGRAARRHSMKLCAACEREASHKVTIQTSWFRGEDEVLMLCGGHKEMAVAGDWVSLYDDIKSVDRKP